MTRKDVLNNFFEYNLSYTSYEPFENYPENVFELKLKFLEVKEALCDPYSDYRIAFSGMDFNSFKKFIDVEYSKWLCA